MGCNVHLFALQGNCFAEKLRADTDDIVDRVAKWAGSQRIRGRELTSGLRDVETICRGNLPNRCSSAYFVALAWMGDATMERVKIPEFCDLKWFSYVEQYGIIKGLSKYSAPFLLPRSKEIPPFAGYLPWTHMPAFEFERFPGHRTEAMDALRRQVDSTFSELSKQLVGRRTASPSFGGLSREEVAFARQEFADVLATLVDDKLDLLAVIL